MFEATCYPILRWNWNFCSTSNPYHENLSRRGWYGRYISNVLLNFFMTTFFFVESGFSAPRWKDTNCEPQRHLDHADILRTEMASLPHEKTPKEIPSDALVHGTDECNCFSTIYFTDSPMQIYQNNTRTTVVHVHHFIYVCCLHLVNLSVIWLKCA